MYWKNACAMPGDMAPVSIRTHAMSRMTACDRRDRKRMSGLTLLVRKSVFRAATRTFSVYEETFSNTPCSFFLFFCEMCIRDRRISVFLSFT